MTRKELREIRGRMGLTQAELAERIRVARNSVARMENGRQAITPPMELLIQYVAREAGIDPAHQGRSRGAAQDKAAHGKKPGASGGRGRKVVSVQAKRR